MLNNVTVRLVRCASKIIREARFYIRRILTSPSLTSLLHDVDTHTYIIRFRQSLSDCELRHSNLPPDIMIFAWSRNFGPKWQILSNEVSCMTQINKSLHLAQYLSADIICSEKRPVFRERSLACFGTKWRLLCSLSFKCFSQHTRF